MLQYGGNVNVFCFVLNVDIKCISKIPQCYSEAIFCFRLIAPIYNGIILINLIETHLPKPQSQTDKYISTPAILETFFIMATQSMDRLTALVLHFFILMTIQQLLRAHLPLAQGFATPCAISPAAGYVFQSVKLGRAD